MEMIGLIIFLFLERRVWKKEFLLLLSVLALGKGAHAWIFFEDKVPASLARRMGSFLITKTMSKRYQLNMKSYDRLFPNQDTLPKGGFGNLIALPFQKEAMRHGNSVFIDGNCNPYTDQWGFLSSIKRMSLVDIEKFSKEASSNKEIIGVRMCPVDENDPPWMRLPSGKRKYKPIINGLPDKIELVIADRIYIKTNGIPSVLLNQIKRLAAFQNPEFYKRQNMRLSTFLTPRVISCSEILDGYLAIPRGCLNDLFYLLNEYGLELNIKDERVVGKRIKFRFYGSLTKEQKAASRKVIKDDLGILVAPPGMGKTVIALFLDFQRHLNRDINIDLICADTFRNLVFKYFIHEINAGNRPFYQLRRQQADEYIAGLCGFISLMQTRAFALLCGLKLFSSFLQREGMLDAEEHTRIMKDIAYLKEGLCAAFKQELWKYQFIQQWL
jgi:hypothetical protein